MPQKQATISKVDLTRDLHGSFIADNQIQDYEYMREHLRTLIDQDVKSGGYPPLFKRGKELRVVAGDNNMRSSFQAKLLNNANQKEAVIKVYDKVLDLLSRQGTDAVGSRMKWLIESASE